MEFTYVGEWVDWKSQFPSEERMLNDIAYMFYHPEDFENWKDLYNDACDTFIEATGKGQMDIINYLVEIEDLANAEVQNL